jgi:hypothetical protein
VSISRRSFFGGILLATGAVAAEPGFTRRQLPPQSRWTAEQVRGRDRAERLFRRRAIPREYRDQLFEGLAFAVADGKRDHQEIVDAARVYLERAFPEVPNWLKWLAVCLSIMASLLAILLLFL